MPFYYRAETKGIQRWILATPRLRELRGGSAAIEYATEQARNLLMACHADVHQAAAGAIACVFPDRDALERFASTWPYQAAMLLPGLQVIQAWAPCASNTPTNDEVRPVYEKLGANRNAALPPSIEAGPLVARNARTGLPATGRAVNSPGQMLTDELTEAKERHQNTPHYHWAHVDDVALGLSDTYEGLVAVVHADGTGVGKRAAGVSAADRQAFSQGLAAAANNALENAIREVAAEMNTSHLPLQVVVCGGDDLTFIAKANLGLPLARAWLKHFEALTAALPGGSAAPGEFNGLRAGAGIAYASARHPFYKSYELAEDLAKLAKNAAKDSEGNPLDSVIAMRRITTSFEDHDLNQGVWRLAEDGHHGTGPLPTLAQLDTLAGNVRGVSRGPVRQWLGAFEDDLTMGRNAGVSTANALWDRLLELHEPGFVRVCDQLKKVGATTDTHGEIGGSLPPVSPDGKPWTPLRDALMLNVIERRTNEVVA
jgi:hypothetical protein